LKTTPPDAPSFHAERSGAGSSSAQWHINVIPAPETALIKIYVISRVPVGVVGDGEIIRIVPADQATDFVLDTPLADEGRYRYIVTAVNRYNQESAGVGLTN
jgi:hypothetical protein